MPARLANPSALPWRRWYGIESWIQRARAQLREQPLCVLCLAKGAVTPATIADHVESHRGDWNKFRLGQLQSLCASCHNSGKRLVETRGYDRDIGADGWPIDPRHPVYNH